MRTLQYGTAEGPDSKLAHHKHGALAGVQASASVTALDPRYDRAPSEKALAKEIVQLEKKMLEFARNLEFEKAAKARDELSRLKQRAFGAGALRDQVEVPPSAADLPPPASGMRAA